MITDGSKQKGRWVSPFKKYEANIDVSRGSIVYQDNDEEHMLLFII